MPARNRTVPYTAVTDIASAITTNYGSGGGVTGSSPYQVSYTKSSSQSEMNDHVTPGFRHLSERGAIVNHSAEKVELFTRAFQGPYQNKLISTSDGKGWDLSGSYPPLEYLNVFWPNWQDSFLSATMRISDTETGDLWNIRNEATVALKSDVKAAVISLGESLGELGESLGMVQDLTKQTLKFVRTLYSLSQGSSFEVLKKGSKSTSKHLKRLKSGKERAKAIKAASDAWLTYRYGIRPIINDVVGFNEAFHAKLKQRETFRATRATSSRKTEYHTYLFTSGAGYRVNVQVTCEWENKYKVRCGSLYSHTSKTLQRARHFGLDKVLTLPWEFVPYSFVVDWVLDVGGWLESIFPVIGMNHLASWTKTEYVNTQSISVHGSSAGTYVPNKQHTHSYAGSVNNLTRGWSRAPGLSQTWPVPQVRLNLSKVLDIGAMITQIRASYR